MVLRQTDSLFALSQNNILKTLCLYLCLCACFKCSSKNLFIEDNTQMSQTFCTESDNTIAIDHKEHNREACESWSYAGQYNLL